MKQERGDICWAEAGPIKWQRFDARFQELKSRDLNLNIPLSSLSLSLSLAGAHLASVELCSGRAEIQFNPPPSNQSKESEIQSIFWQRFNFNF